MRKVLLIEDDADCRTPAAALLRLHGWEVFESADGAAGLTICLEQRPDVVLCDLLLPGMNGFQICKEIRRHPQLQHTKIIVLTGGSYETDRQLAIDSGADDFLVKPVNAALLLELAERLAAELPKREENSAAEVGPPAYLQFWGVRGSIPTPGPSTAFYGGNTSCVELRVDGQIIILDAGSGIRPLGLRLAEEFHGEAMDLTVLISHTHWDHIQGFPFFTPAYDRHNRVRILGYDGAASSLAATLAGQMESPYFPIALGQMPANVEIAELKEMAFQIGSVGVTACVMNHPGMAVGYRLTTSGRSVAYMPDNEPICSGAGHGANGQPDLAMDRRLLEFIQGVDVLISDSQYDRAEYDCHIGWGHGCVDDVVELALAAGVQQLFLFHHDPNHNDARISAMVERSRRRVAERGGTMRVDAAREGERFMLRAEGKTG